MSSGVTLLDTLLAFAQRPVRWLAGVSLPPRTAQEIFRERVRLMRLLGWADWRWVVAMLVGHAVSAATPALTALVVGWLVASVLDAGSLSQLAGPLVAFAAVNVASRAGGLLVDTASAIVAPQIDHRTRRRAREITLAPRTIDHLDDPEFQDDVMRVTDIGLFFRPRSPGTASVGLVQLIRRFAASLAAAAVVAQFSVLLAVVLFALSLLVRSVVRTQWLSIHGLQDEMTPAKRQAGYWSDLAGGEDAAKEARLFGLGGWITNGRTEITRSWMDTVLERRLTVYGKQRWLMVINAGMGVGAVFPASLATVNGTIGVNELATYLVAAVGVFAISTFGNEAWDIEYGIGAVKALDKLDLRETVDPKRARRSRALQPIPKRETPPRVEFHSVSFAYPLSDTPLLDGLSLRIEPGEVLAIVGVNGAGKTTMMKLLGGLHEPSAGRITIDGVDLSDADIDQWRGHLAVLFQDFVRYPLSAAENVFAGTSHQLPGDDAIDEAVRAAGAHDLLAALPDGLETWLTRLRTGGTDLSGGQWQRVALARILHAVASGRDVVVLDEPTAHLDVQSEATFYHDVVSAVSNATVVLISHRLSTVRYADRIVLLDGGTITESGSHDQLLAADGIYARMFGLQRARFAQDQEIAQSGRGV